MHSEFSSYWLLLHVLLTWWVVALPANTFSFMRVAGTPQPINERHMLFGTDMAGRPRVLVYQTDLEHYYA
jgi:hypothetical protein